MHAIKLVASLIANGIQTPVAKSVNKYTPVAPKVEALKTPSLSTLKAQPISKLITPLPALRMKLI